MLQAPNRNLGLAMNAMYLAWLKRNQSSQRPGGEFDRYLSGQTGDYDYQAAYLNGVDRNSQTNHFTDAYKMPWHPTFSNESNYYKPGMPAIQWINGQPVPIGLNNGNLQRQ